MTRYFFCFSIGNGTETVSDNEGTLLADDAAARSEATRALVEIARDWEGAGYPNASVRVTDSHGDTRFTLQLRFDELTD